MTSKDQLRMDRLILHTREHGLNQGLRKAERDAEKIENPQKLRARAEILERSGFRVLADVFHGRLDWLRAQGVV